MERNGWCFEDRERSLDELKRLFNNLFFWATVIDFNGISFQDFLVSITIPKIVDRRSLCIHRVYLGYAYSLILINFILPIKIKYFEYFCPFCLVLIFFLHLTSSATLAWVSLGTVGYRVNMYGYILNSLLSNWILQQDLYFHP